MQMKSKKIFDKVLKNGKYFLVDPVSCIFLSEETNSEKSSLIKLTGTVVKKKYLRNQFTEIE
ncbi:hypothetical protein [Blattabacterium cuenoti]|uniref:hypothetical protein n=1 Tax=Blattabacterium cuenoti TaxID=1653831 RepID=UPI001EEC069B|nr:hypothetical protein [Blattabacterium cuenoti]